MAKTPQTLFQRLTRLFRSGPIVKRKIRALDTIGASVDNTKSSGALLFQKSLSPAYASITSNAYNLSERLMRYQDFIEMEYTPEIASALDIYADETASQDEKGRILQIFSENEKIKQILEDLFYNTLNIEFNIRPWVRNLCKYGDFFLFNDVSPEHGVINAFPIAVNEIEREENFDRDDPFAVRYRWITLGNRVLENWEISHFRLLGNDMFLPYGSSIIEPARRIWRQLILIEDAMLVYRIVRAPERRVFYIDVANMPAAEVAPYIEAQRKTLRTAQVIDNTTGRVDLRYNPLSADEDYFLPVRGSESGTKIDTLAGGQNTAAVEDVAYIQKKLFAALKVPRAYLGYDEALSCVVPETPVPLLDGRVLTVEEIRKELDDGKKVWVYSVNQETHELVPGEVELSTPTRANAELVRVTLDNGSTFDTTPDHKWMLRDGTWCEASLLEPGTSLMPLYKRKKSLHGGSDYEQVYDPFTEKWMWTHSLVAERAPDEIQQDNDTISEKRLTIHHIDFNRFNNTPSNLLRIGWNAHRQLHQDKLSEIRQQTLLRGGYSGLNNGWANKCRQKIIHLWNMPKLIEWCNTNHPTSKRALMKGYGLSETQLHHLFTENNTTYKSFSEAYMGGYRLARKGVGNYTLSGYRREGTFATKCKDAGISTTIKIQCLACNADVITPRRKPVKFCNMACWRAAQKKKNHTVVSVVFLTERRQTWCLSIKKWGNFALENGTIISNSKSTLAQEDIRFSRTISVIQKTMLAELNKLAIIHLYANGYNEDDLQNFTLRLSNPSTIAQQQKLELWRTKFEVGGSLPADMGSAEFVQKEIWGLSDDQIDEINRQRTKEVLFKMKLESLSAVDDVAGGDAGGGDDLFGDDTSADEPDAAAEPDADATPPEENAGEEPEEDQQGLSLLTASDNVSDEEFDLHLQAKLKPKTSSPIKPQSQLKRALYNQSRKRTHGASKTSMPDFETMMSHNSKSLNDPFDQNWSKSLISNPFGESVNTKKQRIHNGFTPDVWSTLNKMTIHMNLQNKASNNSMLNEDVNFEEDDDESLYEDEK